jgi:hypothetical protein
MQPQRSENIMIDNLIKEVKLDIKSQGHLEIDNRLHRKTRAVNAYKLIYPHIDKVRLSQMNVKYNLDWLRMYHSFLTACKKLKEDKHTRQAMFFNLDDFDNIMPCFCSFQVVHNWRGKYDIIIYQRSGDVAKLKDDIYFFEWVAGQVENKTGLHVDSLKVIYGSIHEQLK